MYIHRAGHARCSSEREFYFYTVFLPQGYGVIVVPSLNFKTAQSTEFVPSSTLTSRLLKFHFVIPRGNSIRKFERKEI